MIGIGDFAVRQVNGRWKYLVTLVDGTIREVTFKEYVRQRARADKMPLVGGRLRLIDRDDSLWDAMLDAFVEALANEGTTRWR